MRIIHFYADWCNPCHQMIATIEKLGIEKYNVEDDDFGFVSRFNIRSVPTLLIIDKNLCEVSRISGYRTEEQVVEWIKQNS